MSDLLTRAWDFGQHSPIAAAGPSTARLAPAPVIFDHHPHPPTSSTTTHILTSGAETEGAHRPSSTCEHQPLAEHGPTSEEGGYFDVVPTGSALGITFDLLTPHQTGGQTFVRVHTRPAPTAADGDRAREATDIEEEGWLVPLSIVDGKEPLTQDELDRLDTIDLFNSYCSEYSGASSLPRPPSPSLLKAVDNAARERLATMARPGGVLRRGSAPGRIQTLSAISDQHGCEQDGLAEDVLPPYCGVTPPTMSGFPTSQVRRGSADSATPSSIGAGGVHERYASAPSWLDSPATSISTTFTTPSMTDGVGLSGLSPAQEVYQLGEAGPPRRRLTFDETRTEWQYPHPQQDGHAAAHAHMGRSFSCGGPVGPVGPVPASSTSLHAHRHSFAGAVHQGSSFGQSTPAPPIATGTWYGSPHYATPPVSYHPPSSAASPGAPLVGGAILDEAVPAHGFVRSGHTGGHSRRTSVSQTTSSIRLARAASIAGPLARMPSCGAAGPVAGDASTTGAAVAALQALHSTPTPLLPGPAPVETFDPAGPFAPIHRSPGSCSDASPLGGSDLSPVDQLLDVDAHAASGSSSHRTSKPRGRDVQSVGGAGGVVDPTRKYICQVPNCGRAYKCVIISFLVVERC